MAQWVERPTKKPGAILTRVRVPGAARDLSPRVSIPCRLSYVVGTALCAISAISILRTLKTPKHWQPLFGHTKILHTMIGMGNSAFAAAVPYPAR